MTKPITLHPLLPEKIRKRLSGQDVAVHISKPVRMRMKQPEKLTVSQCVAKYRVVTGVDSRPGKWRNDLVPHTVKVMDLFLKPWIKEIWLCWPERTAKTNVLMNCLATVAKIAPGNVFWLEPADDDGGTNLKTKIIPMFRESPGLRKYLSSRADDTGKRLIAFSHGMHLFPASANSARTMANFFGKYNFGNEVDKYPAMVGTETDPIKLIRKRGRDDRGSKFIFASTPAGKYIYSGAMACRQVWEYRNRCPHCKALVLMDDDHLDIPPGATPEQVENGDVEIGYICNSCAAVWSEEDRKKSYAAGDWHIAKGADDPRPRSVGTHASALPFPMIPLAEYAGKYLRSKNGSLADRRDYSHGYKVIDHVEEGALTVTEEGLLRFRSDLPRNLVPPDTYCLGLVVDTQQSSFYYQVWAFGYSPEYRMHMVRHGIVEKFIDLEGLLQTEEMKDHTGMVYRIGPGLIDSGGTRRGYQKHSRTVEVYEWCSRNRQVMPVKGAQGRNGEMISYKDVATYPGTNIAIPGLLKRANLRVDLFKDELERRLAIEPDDPGALSFHDGIDEAFAKHYTTEYKDEAGAWTHNRSKGRNDYFDCNGYALGLLEMIKLRIPMKPEPVVAEEVAPAKTETQRTRRGGRW